MTRLIVRLHTLAWLWLALSAPLFLFMTPARAPILLLLPLLIALRRSTTGRWLPRTPFDWPILSLAILALVSLLTTPDLAYSLPKVAGLLFGIVVFYTTAETATRSPRYFWLALTAIAVLSLGLASIGLLGWRGSAAKIPGLSALAALLPTRIVALSGAEEGVNPNEIAGVALWGAPLALTVTVLGLSPSRRHLMGIGKRLALVVWGLAGLSALGLLAILLLTQSRSGLIGFTIALLWLLFLAATRRRGSAWLLLVVLGLLVVVGIGWPGPERLQNLWSQNLIVAPSGQASWSALAARPEIWSRALYALQDFPWTGLGMNMFRRQVHELYPYVTVAPGTDLGHAHNQFLQAGVDLGLPGLIAYAALWLVSGLVLARGWYAATLPWARWLTAGLSATLLGALIFGLTDAIALGARPGFVWWMVLGFVAVLPIEPASLKTTLLPCSE